MNSFKTFFMVLVTAAAITLACASTPVSSSESTSEPSFFNKDWNLVELKSESGNIIFNRNKMAAEEIGNFFFLRFDSERVSGVGAPNRFFGNYTLLDNQALRINPLASTLMATFREPEELREYEYFKYLQNASKWNLNRGKLEIYSKKDDGSEAILVFAPVGN
jgi:heat shock protein HslJ